jgi:hypothetical protein
MRRTKKSCGLGFDVSASSRRRRQTPQRQLQVAAWSSSAARKMVPRSSQLAARRWRLMHDPPVYGMGLAAFRGDRIVNGGPPGECFERLDFETSSQTLGLEYEN